MSIPSRKRSKRWENFGDLSRPQPRERLLAEKQRGEGRDGVERHESFQHVPEMFDEIVETTLSRVWRITEPLRGRLRAQTETGRVFPEYQPVDLMPATEFFTRLFGTLHVQ